MKELVARARVAMNLILVATLLLGWAGLRHPPDAIWPVFQFHLSLIAMKNEDPATYKVILNNFERMMNWRGDGPLANAVVKLKVDQLLNFHVPPVVTTLDWSGDAPSTSFSLEQKYRNLEMWRDVFRAYVMKSGVPPEATIGLLQEQLSTTIKIPFVDQTVPAATATVLLAVGAVALLLYVISVCITIRREAPLSPNREGANWIFHHWGRVSGFLGTAWLLGPALALLAGGWTGSELMVNSRAFVVGLALLPVCILACIFAFRARKAFHLRLRALSGDQASNR